MSDFKLLGNRVAIRPIKSAGVTQGGIQLITAQSSLRGTVVAVGPGVHLDSGDFIPTTVKVGDTVVYLKQSEQNKMELGGEVLIVTSELEIVAIISE